MLVKYFCLFDCFAMLKVICKSSHFSLSLCSCSCCLTHYIIHTLSQHHTQRNPHHAPTLLPRTRNLPCPHDTLRLQPLQSPPIPPTRHTATIHSRHPPPRGGQTNHTTRYRSRTGVSTGELFSLFVWGGFTRLFWGH